MNKTTDLEVRLTLDRITGKITFQPFVLLHQGIIDGLGVRVRHSPEHQPIMGLEANHSLEMSVKTAVDTGVPVACHVTVVGGDGSDTPAQAGRVAGDLLGEDASVEHV